MSKPIVLLIEDSSEIRSIVKLALETERYAVIEALDGAQALRSLKTSQPLVILLDLLLPDENGLALIAKLRKHSDAPIVIVSGKVSLIDKVIGFEAGADDYITKPFQVQELVARVKAHARRFKRTILTRPEPQRAAQATRVKFGDWMMDRASMQVSGQGGEACDLTTREFKLLEVFVLSPNFVFSREQLLDATRGFGFNVTERAIDTQIVRLRKKLKDHLTDKPLIKSVKGIGYIFTSPTEALLE